MRCLVRGEDLVEFEREDDTIVLCPKHAERATAAGQGGAPAAEAPPPPAADDKPVPMCATDGHTGDPIFSLDAGKTWAFGEPPDDDPNVEADAVVETEPPPPPAVVETEPPPPPPATVTAVTVEHSDVLALVAPLRDEYTAMGGQLVGFAVNSQETLDMVGALLVDVKGKMKALDKARQKIVRPLIDAKKAVDDLFRPATGAAKHVEGLLKAALSAYTDAQQAAQVSALAAGDHVGALAIEQPTMPAGVSTRTVWRWRVTDAALVPDAYKVIDSAAVQSHVNQYKGQAQIPGIEAFPETGISARGGS